MHYRVRYSLDFDLKIRTGQGCIVEGVEGLSLSRVSKVHSPAFPRLCVHCKIDRTAFLVACLTQFNLWSLQLKNFDHLQIFSEPIIH